MSIEDFRRSYQLAPILLMGGIAANAPNGQQTILSITEGSDTVNYGNNLSAYFAHFEPVPGGTLVDFEIARYPFASMAMAANAMLQKPLVISMKMICPARTDQNNYEALQATISGLQQLLTAHNLAGGTFTVATPATIYTDCLFKTMRDVTNAGDKKVQQVFQLDFEQPLVATAAAEAVYNNLYSKMNGGLPVPNPPTNSGPAAVIGSATNTQPVTTPGSGTGPA